MKRFKKTVALTVTLFGLAITAASCGKKDDGNSGRGSSAPGPVSIVQHTPGGPASISFTGQNVYINSPVVSAGLVLAPHNYFVDPGFGAWLFLNNSRRGGPGTITLASVLPVNGGSTIYGRSGIDTNNALIMNVQQGNDVFHYNVTSGMLSLSAQTVQRLFGGNMPQVIGLTIDVGLNGTTLGAGGILIYTSIDSSGQYHGKFLAF